MLTEIRLKNFKCFKYETKFPLGKINLLTGVNGRGKSSLLQAMLLFRQSIEHNPNSNALVLNGNCVQLGSFEDVKNSENPKEMDIEIGFTTDDRRFSSNSDFHFWLSLNLKLAQHQDNPRILQPLVLTLTSDVQLSVNDGKGNFQNELAYTPMGGDKAWRRKEIINGDESITILRSYLFLPDNSISVTEINKEGQYSASLFMWFDFYRIRYISADRIGPKNSYQQENLSDFINTGARGENTATILALKGDNTHVHYKLYLGNDANTLLQQTEEWLNYIFEGAKVSIEATGDNIDISYNTNQKSHRYRATNVGFGYSYILPIIVSGLIAKEGEFLIVENPEAHLHPKAQNRLTEFLTRVATCGVQVFVESHSEHILNGLRICSLREDIELNHDEVSILYFQNNDHQPFVQLPILKNGKITNWPDGFFDQQEQDLAEIFKLGREKK